MGGFQYLTVARLIIIIKLKSTQGWSPSDSQAERKPVGRSQAEEVGCVDAPLVRFLRKDQPSGPPPAGPKTRKMVPGNPAVAEILNPDF